MNRAPDHGGRPTRPRTRGRRGAHHARALASGGLALGLALVGAAQAGPPGAGGTAAAQAPRPNTSSTPGGAAAPSASGMPDASATPAASAPTAIAPAPSSAPTEKAWSSCVEYVPEGAIRPKIEAHFPPNGLSGHELRLIVVVTHGRGETVLPAGFRLERGSDAMRAIEAAKFRVPEPSGGSPPTIDRPKDAEVESADRKTLTTTLGLPFVALPSEPGRHALRLPPLPIAVGRANGQVMTVCTPAMPIAIEDPIANDSEPTVKPNPPPRSQREEWLLAKQVTLGGLLVLALAGLGAYLLHRWSRRPRPTPVVRREPPWVTALEELGRIRTERLIEDGQLDVFVDRVNDCVRRYLGERFGFDGLESTTEEIRRLLGRVSPPVVERRAIEAFLDDTDLVKFAKFTPGPDDCTEILGQAETIVRSTIPADALQTRRRP